MATAQTTQGDTEKLAGLIHGIRVAMLTSVEDDGTLRSRPMMTQKTAFDGTLWFFTREHSAKAHEIGRDQHVCLSYGSPDDDRYVSVSGLGSVIQDRAQAEKLWNPLYKAWFAKGLDDPELALLKVKVTRAEYWDVKSGKMLQLVGFAKALLTGTTIDHLAEDGKRHGTITLEANKTV
jgi:general stress protein 26